MKQIAGTKALSGEENIALAWSHLCDIPLLLKEGIAGIDPHTEDCQDHIGDLWVLVDVIERLRRKYEPALKELAGEAG